MSETKSLAVELAPGQSISIGDGILLTIEKKTGKVARIRITAPSDIKIGRREIDPGLREVMRNLGVMEKA